MTRNGVDGSGISATADDLMLARHWYWGRIAALRKGGSIVYWSVGDDPRFATALRRAGLGVSTLTVRAHDTSGPMHTLYVATPRA